MAEQRQTNAAAESAAEPAGESIAELRARVAELEDQWRRALADLDNLRKRVARDSTAQWMSPCPVGRERSGGSIRLRWCAARSNESSGRSGS